MCGETDNLMQLPAGPKLLIDVDGAQAQASGALWSEVRRLATAFYTMKSHDDDKNDDSQFRWVPRSVSVASCRIFGFYAQASNSSTGMP